MDDLKLRQEIIRSCRFMNESGLNQGTSGNISVRLGDRFLITPSAMPYEDLEPEDILSMGFDGSHDPEKVPSSEWRFHLDILKAKPEAGAVVHTHSAYATTIAIMGIDIPAVHYMVAAAGGNSVRCAKYATYGTEDLAINAVEAMRDRKACLLANHGLIATGGTLQQAMWLTVEVENLARQFFNVLQVGRYNVLPDDEIDRVLEKFQTYGIRPKLAAE